MVDAGHWRWADPTPALPGVAGVPLTNYAGWPRGPADGRSRTSSPDAPGRRGRRAVFALYLWTYFSSVLALTGVLRLAASALWGGLAMGLVAVPARVVLR